MFLVERFSGFVRGDQFHSTTTKKNDPLVDYYKKIESSELFKISTSEDLGRILDNLSEMETKYQAYLKAHCCFARFFLNLCWWDSSVHGAYKHCFRTLVGRVAEGYENKMMSLVFCKNLLKNSMHRSFMEQALTMTVSNTHQRKDVKGFTWKVTNAQGVTSYLIGTIHQGTFAMAKAKGVQEAIEKSDKFITEKGFIFKFWRSSCFPLMTRDMRFLFILDRHIALEADRRNKEVLVLDSRQLTRETHQKVKEVKMKQEQNGSIFLLEMPEDTYFSSETPSTKTLKKIQADIRTYYLFQSISLWQKGNEVEEKAFNTPFLNEATYTLCDERTKAWLQHSFKSKDSKDPLPGLIEQVRDAKKPVCIAVGNLHCIGSRISLVEEFKNAGFEVSLIE